MGSKEAAKIVWEKNSALHQFLRKWRWHHSVHRRMGMLYHDNFNENDTIIEEAINRLPPHLADARLERCHRASMVSMKNEWLPKDQWTTWEDETWYLKPYLDEVTKEVMDYQRYRGKWAWWQWRNFYDKMEH